MTRPGTGEFEYTGPFNEAFELIQEGMRRAVRAFNDIVDQVNRWAWLLGPATLLWIKHNLDAVREVLRAVMDKVRYALEHQLPVLSLISTSFRWVTDVKTPVSEMSAATVRPASDNFYKWSGDAASAYKDKATLQKGGVDEVVVKAEFISQWLFTIAKANVDYAVTLAKIVTDFASKLIQAAADAGTVIDIPWAIDSLADSAATLSKGLMDTLLSIGQRFVDALGNVRDLATQVGDHSKLPAGAWPEAVRG